MRMNALLNKSLAAFLLLKRVEINQTLKIFAKNKKIKKKAQAKPHLKNHFRVKAFIEESGVKN